MDQQLAITTATEITLGKIVQTFMDEEIFASARQTQNWYKCRLGLFRDAIGEDRPLSDITKKELIGWWKSLEARTLEKPPTLTVDTFHGYVRAVRRLFHWMYDQHLTVTELWKTIKLPRLPERQRKGIDASSLLKLISAARGNPRDYAILMFMESTGARRGGVASLTLDDLSIDEPEPRCRRATVHEKALTARTVMLTPACLEAMKAWLAVRRSDTNYVFVDNRFEHDNNLDPGAINQMIVRYQRRLGLRGHCSPHQWRHRFCRSRLIEGMPLSIVSQLAGHKSITVTAMIYGNLLVDELQHSYDRFYKPPALDEQEPK